MSGNVSISTQHALIPCRGVSFCFEHVKPSALIARICVALNMSGTGTRTRYMQLSLAFMQWAYYGFVDTPSCNRLIIEQIHGTLLCWLFTPSQKTVRANPVIWSVSCSASIVLGMNDCHFAFHERPSLRVMMMRLSRSIKVLLCSGVFFIKSVENVYSYSVCFHVER